MGSALTDAPALSTRLWLSLCHLRSRVREGALVLCPLPVSWLFPHGKFLGAEFLCEPKVGGLTE